MAKVEFRCRAGKNCGIDVVVDIDRKIAQEMLKERKGLKGGRPDRQVVWWDAFRVKRIGGERLRVNEKWDASLTADGVGVETATVDSLATFVYSWGCVDWKVIEHIAKGVKVPECRIGFD